MKEAAWKYAHHSQIILDGTFGICNKKMLLFIAMGVDEANRGVPLAFFLFSAPQDNQRTCAGYDMEILERMLRVWLQSLGTRDGEAFEVWVAITDTDLMEHLKGRLKRLEDALVEMVEFSVAKTLLQQERETLIALRTSAGPGDSSDTTYTKALEGALEHVDWSRFGRLTAAALLKRPVNKVLPTTNHLESFNGVLKREHLSRWRKGGQRLRLDVLIHVLVNNVLPSIFRLRELENLESARCKAIIEKLPGGLALIRAREGTSKTLGPLAYLAPDDARDHAAAELVSCKQISAPSLDDTGNTLTFSCYSSLAVEGEAHPTKYDIILRTDGTGSCSCKDFTTRGSACKHMHAALAKILILRASGINIPFIYLPTSIEDVYTLRARQLANNFSITPGPSFLIDTDPIADVTAAIEALMLDTKSDEGSENGGVEDAEAKVLPESDNESAVEDQPSEDVNLVPPVACRVEVRDGERIGDSAVIAGTSQEGLNDQTLARVMFDLEHIQPKLNQLADWLRSTHLTAEASAERQKRIIGMRTSFRSSVDNVTQQLDRLALESATHTRTLTSVLSPPSRAITPPPIPSKHGKRPAVDIIGPSPERKAQRRHDSHAPH
ncbi:hypothetical protein NM688_g2298 [Phlebia brevispora]|uniref:Uncharacterized protein n=1 Tax=Phlebia brevispora TaxID=194682 RepID=A0ACC1T8W3_9APHY|nr:hypothetical protein NM688_g2298 [Phlebia brevispora]